MEVWKIAVKMIAVANGLDDGKPLADRTPSLAKTPSSDQHRPAVKQAVATILSEAARFAKARRCLGTTGAHGAPQEPFSAATQLVKFAQADGGYVRMKKNRVNQVPIVANSIDEPKTNHVVPMLQALPPQEAEHYALETNVVDTAGKSSIIFREISEQYGFIGGSMEEFVSYFQRPDLPKQMWRWAPWASCRAVAGFTVVPKKDPSKLRKLLMCCPANYMFEDPRYRAELGMGGGGAITRIHIPSDNLACSACDESNAFTYVLTPEWLWPWFSTPPIRAFHVWDCLPDDFRSQIDVTTLVSAQYMRLPMGCTHSVHILMLINLRYIGITLLASQHLNVNRANRQRAEGLAHLHAAPTHGDADATCLATAAGRDSECSPEEWIEILRSARSSSFRVLVVLLCFMGDRRHGDICDWLETMAQAQGLTLLVISADVAIDSRWDFTNPALVHKFLVAAHEGLIDVIGGSPPSGTLSDTRVNDSVTGLRFLRSRERFWGCPGLNSAEQTQIRRTNALFVNFLAMAEAVCAAGGRFFLAHADDPGEAPHPSLFVTAEMLEFEGRVGAMRAHHHQCAFGGADMSPTCISTNCSQGFRLEGLWCPGHLEHSSECQRYQRKYVSEYAYAIADMVFHELRYLAHNEIGPTSSAQSSHLAKKVSCYGSRMGSATSPAISILNEDICLGRHVHIHDHQGAVYLHVDDAVTISTGTSSDIHADRVMHFLAEGLEDAGFIVPERVQAADVQKVVGYQPVARPARFKLPDHKWALLADALKELAVPVWIDVEVLRAVLGVWVFAALLNRDLLSIPHAVYRMLDAHPNETIRWWPSARREVLAMSYAAPWLFYDAGAPLATTIFATDAMGNSEVDAGGYGITVRDVSRAAIEQILEYGESQGRSVSRLSGDFTGLKFPERPIKASKPFSLLPNEIFQNEGKARWLPMAWGRWKTVDHITLGEARAVVRLARLLSVRPSAHRHFVISLQDNQPCAWSHAKGRSTSWPLNRLWRMKTSSLLVSAIRLFLPWVESAMMPADMLSRQHEYIPRQKLLRPPQA